MASAAAAAAACSSASSAPEKYSSSGCANQRARYASVAASTGSGVAPKLPWFSRAMPGAWWSKSDANFAALRRARERGCPLRWLPVLETDGLPARIDNDGNRIDASAQRRVHSGRDLCVRLGARGAPIRRPGMPSRRRPLLSLRRTPNAIPPPWPHRRKRLVERAVLCGRRGYDGRSSTVTAGLWRGSHVGVQRRRRRLVARHGDGPPAPHLPRRHFISHDRGGSRDTSHPPEAIERAGVDTKHVDPGHRRGCPSGAASACGRWYLCLLL